MEVPQAVNILLNDLVNEVINKMSGDDALVTHGMVHETPPARTESESKDSKGTLKEFKMLKKEFEIQSQVIKDLKKDISNLELQHEADIEYLEDELLQVKCTNEDLLVAVEISQEENDELKKYVEEKVEATGNLKTEVLDLENKLSSRIEQLASLKEELDHSKSVKEEKSKKLIAAQDEIKVLKDEIEIKNQAVDTIKNENQRLENHLSLQMEQVESRNEEYSSQSVLAAHETKLLMEDLQLVVQAMENLKGNNQDLEMQRDTYIKQLSCLQLELQHSESSRKENIHELDSVVNEIEQLKEHLKIKIEAVDTIKNENQRLENQLSLQMELLTAMKMELEQVKSRSEEYSSQSVLAAHETKLLMEDLQLVVQAMENLKDNNQDLKMQQDTYIKQLSCLQLELQHSESSRKENIVELDNVVNEIEQLKEHLKIKIEAIQDFERRNLYLEQQKCSLVEQLVQVKDELALSESLGIEKSAKADATSEELEALKSELELKVQCVESIDSINLDLQKQLAGLKDELDHSRLMNEGISSHFTLAREEIVQLTEKFEIKVRIIEELTKENQDLEKQILDVESASREDQAKIAVAAEEIKLLKQDLDQKNQDIECLRTTNVDLEVQKTTYVEELTDLKNKLDSFKSSSDDISSKLASITEENEHLKEEVTLKQQTVENLENIVQDLEKQKSFHVDQLALLKDELALKESLVEENLSKVTAATEEIEHLKQELESRIQAVEDLKIRNSDLDEQKISFLEQIECLKIQSQGFESLTGEMSNKFAAASEEIRLLKADLELKIQAIESLKCNNLDLENQWKCSRDELEHYKLLNEENSLEKEVVVEELALLKEDLELKIQTIYDLEQDKQALTMQNDSADFELASFREQLEQQKAKYTEENERFLTKPFDCFQKRFFFDMFQSFGIILMELLSNAKDFLHRVALIRSFIANMFNDSHDTESCILIQECLIVAAEHAIRQTSEKLKIQCSTIEGLSSENFGSMEKLESINLSKDLLNDIKKVKIELLSLHACLSSGTLSASDNSQPLAEDPVLCDSEEIKEELICYLKEGRQDVNGNFFYVIYNFARNSEFFIRLFGEVSAIPCRESCKERQEILEKENSTLKWDKDSINEQMQSLEQRLSSLKLEHGSSKKVQDDLQKEIVSLKLEKECLNATIEEIEENLQSVFQEKMSLQEDLNTMQSKVMDEGQSGYKEIKDRLRSFNDGLDSHVLPSPENTKSDRLSWIVQSIKLLIDQAEEARKFMLEHDRNVKEVIQCLEEGKLESESDEENDIAFRHFSAAVEQNALLQLDSDFGQNLPEFRTVNEDMNEVPTHIEKLNVDDSCEDDWIQPLNELNACPDDVLEDIEHKLQILNTESLSPCDYDELSTAEEMMEESSQRTHTDDSHKELMNVRAKNDALLKDLQYEKETLRMEVDKLNFVIAELKKTHRRSSSTNSKRERTLKEVCTNTSFQKENVEVKSPKKKPECKDQDLLKLFFANAINVLHLIETTRTLGEGKLSDSICKNTDSEALVSLNFEIQKLKDTIKQFEAWYNAKNAVTNPTGIPLLLSSVEQCLSAIAAIVPTVFKSVDVQHQEREDSPACTPDVTEKQASEIMELREKEQRLVRELDGEQKKVHLCLFNYKRLEKSFNSLKMKYNELCQKKPNYHPSPDNEDQSSMIEDLQRKLTEAKSKLKDLESTERELQETKTELKEREKMVEELCDSHSDTLRKYEAARKESDSNKNLAKYFKRLLQEKQAASEQNP